jgi:hypothetical protein
MGMIPIDRMWERVEIARQDSDTALFLALLYCGEMIVKIIAAGLVAAIRDDRERHRYRQAHKLIRVDGIGDWVSAVDDILTGPASQHLMEQAWEEQRELTGRNTDAVGEIHALVERCQLLNVPFQTVSNAVNRINALFSEHHFVFDSDEKRIISQRLALVMESRISEGDATDCSRLAWLFVRLGDEEKAQIVVERGLSMEPENDYCKNLAARISSHRL